MRDLLMAMLGVDEEGVSWRFVYTEGGTLDGAEATFPDGTRGGVIRSPGGCWYFVVCEDRGDYAAKYAAACGH